MQPNAYICDLILSSMQQFLRYFFSLFCVGALFGAPQVRAASAEVAEGPSEQMMTTAQTEVNITLRGNQLRVTNANGLTVGGAPRHFALMCAAHRVQRATAVE